MPNNTVFNPFTIGSTADLQAALTAIDVGGVDAGTGNTYTFDFAQSVTLSQQLYAVNLTDKTSALTINGNNATLSGNNTYNGLFVYSGTVNVNDLTISNAVAQGGAGGGAHTLGGGGGAGLGGGLFVASGGAVTLGDVAFTQDAARGGAGAGNGGGGDNNFGGGGGLEGGRGGDGFGGGGGGVGLGAVGAYGDTRAHDGGGGIILGAASGGSGAEGKGGAGGGGGGNGGGGGGVDGGNATVVGGLVVGGRGGFGGGGGSSGGGGGAGGFGGGGGDSNVSGARGGIGGFGGGGGGAGASGGFGGGRGGTLAVGGSVYGEGGGGLGAGGDIFVQQGGSLTIGSGSLAAGSVTGGAVTSAGNMTTAGAGLGSGLFIQGNQTVTLAPGAGQDLTISGVIADETGSTLAVGQGTSNGDGTAGGIGTLAVGAGTTTLAGANTYTGGTQLTGGGEIVAGNDAGLGTGTLAMAAGSTLGFTGNRTIANAITVAGDPAYATTEGQSETLSGVIADGATAGTVEKTGIGTLTLTGSNKYTGGTILRGGILVDAPAIAGGDGLGATTGAVTFAGTLGTPATLALANGAQPASGGTFDHTLATFGPNDALDLEGQAFSSAAVTYTPAGATGGTLTVTESGRTESFTLSNPTATSFVATNDGAGGTQIIAASPAAAVCFAAGTRIRVMREETLQDVAVENLVVGDRAVTAAGALKTIRWLGHRVTRCAGHPAPALVNPVRIAAHAFGPNQPIRDLVVSPGHAICLDALGEVLIPAAALVDGASIVQLDVASVTYWHVELEAHDILLAENLACESYLEMGNRRFFAEAAEVALHARPDASIATHEDFCRPFVGDGPLIEAVKTQLAGRAIDVSRRRRGTAA